MVMSDMLCFVPYLFYFKTIVEEDKEVSILDSSCQFVHNTVNIAATLQFWGPSSLLYLKTILAYLGDGDML